MEEFQHLNLQLLLNYFMLPYMEEFQHLYIQVFAIWFKKSKKQMAIFMHI